MALSKAVALAQPAGAAKGIAADDFNELVRRHQRRVYRVLLALVRDRDAADTLTQECFLRAFERRRSFRGESSVEAWLVRIAVNLARDHGRNRRRAFWARLFWNAPDGESGEARAVADSRASPERLLAAREDVAAVWSAVSQLAPQQRAVFVLRFAEEMTLEEIAGATELAVGTVKTHLHRALLAVRKQLKETR